MVKDGGEIMGPAELKPLLHLAKRKAVSCAIGMTKDKEGVILLHKRTKPRKLMAELLRQGKGSGLELDRGTIRFGRASVDGGSDSSTVVFTVNKPAPGPLRMALVAKLRPAGFQRCEIVVDEAIENESDEDEPEEGEDGTPAASHLQQDASSAAHPSAAAADATAIAPTQAAAPAAPTPASAGPNGVAAPVEESRTQPDAAALKATLRGLTEQIRPVIAADPARGRSLVSLATAARDSLASGDFTSAQSGTASLRKALGDTPAGNAAIGDIGRNNPDNPTPVRPSNDTRPSARRSLGDDTGLPGLEHVAADGLSEDPNPAPSGRSFLKRAGDFLADPHTALGAASFAPSGFGSVASIADGLLYAAQGDGANAGISLGAAAIGVVSDAGAARLAMKGVKAGTEALQGAGKAAEAAADASKVGHTAAKASRAAETGGTAAGDAARIEGQAEQSGGQAAEQAVAAAGTPPRLTSEDIAAFRTRINVPKTDTVGLGRTNVPGLEREVFEGASPRVRREAGIVPTADGPIKAPQENPQFMDHAEQDIANQFISKVEAAGLTDEALNGKELLMRIQNETGICNICRQGLNNPDKLPGVLKQLSQRYPGLKVHVVVDNPGPRLRGPSDFILRNGSYVE